MGYRPSTWDVAGAEDCQGSVEFLTEFRWSRFEASVRFAWALMVQRSVAAFYKVQPGDSCSLWGDFRVCVLKSLDSFK